MPPSKSESSDLLVDRLPEYSVMFFDRSGCSDFIVLRTRYEEGLRHRWKAGDPFQTYFADDHQYYRGEIVRQSVLDTDHFPQSPWQSFIVRWTGELKQPFSTATTAAHGRQLNRRMVRETMESSKDDAWSPWEFETIDKKISSSSYSNASLTLETSKILVERIQQLTRQSFSKPFCKDVDPNLYPDYYGLVAYPISLNRMIERLERGFYRHFEAISFDCRRFAMNAAIYNEVGSAIVMSSRHLTKNLLELLESQGYSLTEEDRAIIDEPLKSSYRISDPSSSSSSSSSTAAAASTRKNGKEESTAMMAIGKGKKPSIDENRSMEKSKSMEKPSTSSVVKRRRYILVDSDNESDDNYDYVKNQSFRANSSKNSHKNKTSQGKQRSLRNVIVDESSNDEMTDVSIDSIDSDASDDYKPRTLRRR